MGLFSKPMDRSELEGLGFNLAGSYNHGTGSVTTHHYTKTRQTLGKGRIVRPITHHFVVDEYNKTPGKYDVSYAVTQGGRPFMGGDFDMLRRHKSNASGGLSDPLEALVKHHHAVSYVMDRERSAPPLEPVTPENTHVLSPNTHHMTGDWNDADDPQMKRTKYIVPGPSYRMPKLNSDQSDRSIMEKADEDLRP